MIRTLQRGHAVRPVHRASSSPPTGSTLGADKRPLAAIGFLTVGRRFLNNVHDIIDDRIDVVTRGLMGLTVTCARCHDHKFDPIPTEDYYSLYGVFGSSVEPKELPLIGEPKRTPEVPAFQAEVAKRTAAIDDMIAQRHAAEVAPSSARRRRPPAYLRRRRNSGESERGPGGEAPAAARSRPSSSTGGGLRRGRT